jgi:hypothetical protein
MIVSSHQSDFTPPPRPACSTPLWEVAPAASSQLCSVARARRNSRCSPSRRARFGAVVSALRFEPEVDEFNGGSQVEEEEEEEEEEAWPLRSSVSSSARVRSRALVSVCCARYQIRNKPIDWKRLSRKWPTQRLARAPGRLGKQWCGRWGVAYHVDETLRHTQVLAAVCVGVPRLGLARI